MPCAAASSYPVVPLIWPAKNRFSIAFVSSEGFEIPRIEEVVLDRVAGPRHVRILEAGDRMHDVELHVERQRRRDAVRIDLERRQPFGLDENLVARAIGEPHDLVLDRRAVARSNAFDGTRIERRAVESLANDLVRALRRVRDVAADLARVLGSPPEEREHRRRRIAGLLGEIRVIDGAAVDARRRAGLQAPDRETQVAQPACEADRRWVAGAAARVVDLTDVDLAVEERADRQHDGVGRYLHAGLRDDAVRSRAVEQQAVDVLLQQREVRLGVQQLANRAPIQRAVGLRARRAHGGTFAAVQDPEMDARAIDRARHRAAERVDLLREVPFADAADRGVAAHLPQRLEVLRQEQRAHAHARRGQRSFGAGMAAADYDATVASRVIHKKA